jgi:hypothetical protein
MSKKVGQRDGSELFDAGDFNVLRSTISTLAPELVAPAKPREEPAKPADRYVSSATPKAQQDDEGSAASSVRPRERRGSGMSAHELRATIDKQAAPVELEEGAGDPLDFETGGELDDMLAGEVEDHDHCGGMSEDEEVDRRIQDSLLEDAILDAYRDNMEALAQANATRDFTRGEDLWHERYRFDARNRMDTDEASERSRNSEADRRATEERRRIEDEAARRRLDDDRNRR